MLRTGPPAEATAAQLEADYAAKLAAIEDAQCQHDAILVARPSSESRAAIRGLIGAELAGDMDARRQIAAVLPELVKGITRHPNGMVRIQSKSGLLARTVRIGDVTREPPSAFDGLPEQIARSVADGGTA
jgi:hypothetical protein